MNWYICIVTTFRFAKQTTGGQRTGWLPQLPHLQRIFGRYTRHTTPKGASGVTEFRRTVRRLHTIWPRRHRLDLFVLVVSQRRRGIFRTGLLLRLLLRPRVFIMIVISNSNSGSLVTTSFGRTTSNNTMGARFTHSLHLHRVLFMVRLNGLRGRASVIAIFRYHLLILRVYTGALSRHLV